MSISAKTLGQMTDVEIVGFVQATAVMGADLSHSLATKIRVQLEMRGITYDDMPRIKTEIPSPRELPEPTSLNLQERVALKSLAGNERQALIPWRLTTSPHAHLDGKTVLYQEMSAVFEDYITYGDLCTGCKAGGNCIEFQHGGAHCTPVPMSRGLALLLLYDEHPLIYRTFMAKGAERSLEETANACFCSERTVQRRLDYADDFIKAKFRCHAGYVY